MDVVEALKLRPCVSTVLRALSSLGIRLLFHLDENGVRATWTQQKLSKARFISLLEETIKADHLIDNMAKTTPFILETVQDCRRDILQYF